MSIRERYILTRSEKFTLGPNEEARVDLRLKRKPAKPKTKVTGKVFGDGHPISHATVKILNDQFDPVLHVLTDARGSYLIENLKPGDYKVTATAPGFLVANIVSFCLKAKDTEVINFALKQDAAGREKNIVYGKVTETITSQSVAYAVVKLFSINSPHPCIETTSNKDGQYLLCNISPGQYFVVASKPGFKTSDPITFIATQGQLIKINFQLLHDVSTGGTVSGIITDWSWQEKDGILVGLFKPAADDETLVQVKTTNKDGLYLFSDVEPGEYLVKAKTRDEWQFVQRHTFP